MALYGIPYGAMNPDARKQEQMPVDNGYNPEPSDPIRDAQGRLDKRTGLEQISDYLFESNNPEPQQPDASTYADGKPGALSPEAVEPATVPEPVEVPDSEAAPASAIKATTTNASAGYSGSGIPAIKPAPKPPTEGEVTNAVQEYHGKQVMFDQSKIPEWYHSDSFYDGLLSFGLNILSGNNLADSFNRAGKVFQQGYGREKRQAWANDLARQGYDAQDIQAYIDSGDPKALKDPLQKMREEQQFNLGQYQLQTAAREASPEHQNYLRKRQDWLDNLKIHQIQGEDEARAYNRSVESARLGMERERLGMQRQALEAKHQATQGTLEGFGLDNKTITRLQAQDKQLNDRIANRDSQYQQAANLFKQAKELRAKGGDEVTVSGMITEGRTILARGMKGTLTGSVDLDEIEHNTGNPTLAKRIWSNVKQGAGGDIPDYEIDRLLKLSHAQHVAETQIINDARKQMYQGIERSYGTQKARAAMNILSQPFGDYYEVTGQGQANDNSVTFQ